MINFGANSKLIRCLVIVGLVGLVGCQTKGKPAGAPIANGSWASSDGVYKAEFDNGTFRSIANDTGEVLSQGTYTVNSETSLRIAWSGNVSGKFNSADCTKPNANTMNCVDEGGKQFSLVRGS